MLTTRRLILATTVVVAAAAIVRAQAPPAQTPTVTGRAATTPPPAPPAYPPRPAPDPAAYDRGKTLYSVNCALCHGADARGNQGPSLLRSEILLKDQRGELLADVIRQGRPAKGMPPFPLTAAEASDIAA